MQQDAWERNAAGAAEEQLSVLPVPPAGAMVGAVCTTHRSL